MLRPSPSACAGRPSPVGRRRRHAPVGRRRRPSPVGRRRSACAGFVCSLIMSTGKVSSAISAQVRRAGPLECLYGIKGPQGWISREIRTGRVRIYLRIETDAFTSFGARAHCDIVCARPASAIGVRRKGMCSTRDLPVAVCSMREGFPGYGVCCSNSRARRSLRGRTSHRPGSPATPYVFTE